MKEKEIRHLAFLLKDAKERNRPRAIFFLGAGASVTGNIPLAKQIAGKIQTDYCDNPFIHDLPENERTYSKLMGCLTPNARDSLLKEYICNAKINVTHIYLAQLIAEGFVDYVLTVNFDNLMLRALSLYNLFPSTYDMAILKDLTTTTFKEKSVIYLHGQHHGLWLLNTDEEMSKVKDTVPRILDSIKNERPWIFIGYSGEDPIFDHIKKLGRFDNCCFWIAHNDTAPGTKVQEFLREPNRNAFIIKGYDADSFMLKLNRELGLGQPKVLDKPFSMLQDMVDGIIDIDDQEQFKGVKERLKISKERINRAIAQFEEGKIVILDSERGKIEVELLKKELIDILIGERFAETIISRLEERVGKYNDNELYELLSAIFHNWGTTLGKLSTTKTGDEAENLYHEAIQKYQKSSEIKPDDHETYYNWGTCLGHFAAIKTGFAAETLYYEAFHKYQKSLEIKPDDHKAYYNWGTFLFKLAVIKTGNEAEKLYYEAIQKYKKASEIKPDDYGTYNNWGTTLGNLAALKTGEEAETLYYEAIQKYKKASEIKPDVHKTYYNWGTYLGKLAVLKLGDEAEKLYHEAFQKYKKASEINPDDHDTYYNWGNNLSKLAAVKTGYEAEKLYFEAIQKYQKVSEINPDDHENYNNWGATLGILAAVKTGDEAEKLYHEAFQKYKKASEIKPDDHDTYFNWGNNLGKLAAVKTGYAAEILYYEAIQKYQKAIEIKPDDHEIYYNCGTTLGMLAAVKTGNEAEKLYYEAIQKYQKAIEIKPDNNEVYSNWSSTLLSLSKKKNAEEAEDLVRQALEKSKKSFEHSGRCYNLACSNALLKNKKEALYYLDISLRNREISEEYVLEDEDWIDYLEDEDFKNIMKKYSNEPVTAG